MKLNIRDIDKTLSTAQLKQNIKDSAVLNFYNQLNILFDRFNENESEEHNKNILADFLKDTFYKNKYKINTKDRIDLAIYNGNKSDDSVAVLIEVKKATNTNEMISQNRINVKAFHELLLYFMRETINNNNFSIKHLVITDVKNWYIFDSKDFYNFFYTDKDFMKIFTDLSDEQQILNFTVNNDVYYIRLKEYIEKKEGLINCCYFNLFEYKNSKITDECILNLTKIISPQHLLKKIFVNDSNSLNNEFYNELLYILGLEETSKKTIERIRPKYRNSGSLIENTISILKQKNKLGQLRTKKMPPDVLEEYTFGWALELCIVWLNRILFLKLLEGQLVLYNNNNLDYSFLNKDKINDFDELNELFFDVLADKTNEREEHVKEKYHNIPYLNSSLFDITEIELQTITIESLRDRFEIPIFSHTVLKTPEGKKDKGKIRTLDYLFRFLDAYNFASDSSNIVQKDNKQVINAAVLGLIFEKINGYQDGSHFTPSFITMYMCREVIRKATVDKFNSEMHWNCKDFEELKDHISFVNKDVRLKCNEIVNSLKICDPAVGSGHFLVSALNEIISIKSDLKILNYLDGSRIQDYSIFLDNDEIVTIDNETDEIFGYRLNQKGNQIEKLQKLQMTLFKEKVHIIENCLFGVDINPKSVMICRLRLWIELLKNAFYKAPNFDELETLPNIDINIKCGNSLISRFSLKDDSITKSDAKIIPLYKDAVNRYKNVVKTNEKNKIKSELENYKALLKGTALSKSNLQLQLEKTNQLYKKFLNQEKLFDSQKSKKEQKEFSNKVDAFTSEIHKIEAEIEDINNNPIYQSAFEWRFEFPEVLDDNGYFLGFDIIIGNPPYFNLSTLNNKIKEVIEKQSYTVFSKTSDIYSLFIEKGIDLLKENGMLSFITSNKWMRAGYGESLRNYLSTNTHPIQLINFGGFKVFGSSAVDSNVILTRKISGLNLINETELIDENDKTEIQSVNQNNYDNEEFYGCNIYSDFNIKTSLYKYFNQYKQLMPKLNKDTWVISSDAEQNLKIKISTKGKLFIDYGLNVFFGIKTGFNEAFIIDEETKKELIYRNPNSAEIIKPIIRGRDIKRYKSEFNKIWIINSHNGIKEKQIPSVDVVSNYPAIYNHFKKFKMELEKRQDKGNHWTNLRNCAYLDEFDKEKIVWGNISYHSNFSLIEPHTMILAPANFITSDSVNLRYLIAILNSKLFDYEFRNLGIDLGAAFEWKKQYVEKIHILNLTSIDEQRPFIELVDQILIKKENQEDSKDLEKEIDKLVYQYYDLTDDEIRIVESV